MPAWHGRIFAVTALAFAAPAPLAPSQGSYQHSALQSDKRSYPAGLLCTSHTVPASQLAKRHTPGKAGPPSEWACHPRRQMLSSQLHAWRSQPHAPPEILSCGGTFYRRHRDLTCLGIIDNMRLELGNLGHPRLQLFDTARNIVKAITGPLRLRCQLVIVGQIILNQEVQSSGNFFQIENLWPSAHSLLNYELFGETGLQYRLQNQHYPESLKRQALESYLSGQQSIEAVCKKYQLRSRSQLESWIVMHNGQKGLHSPGGGQKGSWMTRTSYEKGYERRKAAVEYCIGHGKDYKATAVRFGCTYQQIYGWVRTYHAGGLEKLCSHKKSQKKLAEVIEENKRLKEQESFLELELAVRRRLQQLRLQRLGEADFSATRKLPEYQVVEQLHQEQGWSVGRLCKAVGASRAAYYKWKNRAESQKQSNDEQLASLISEIYRSQHGIPGYRQMKLILERRHGIKCNLKRVYRLMRVLGLHSVCRRKKHRRKKKTPADYIAENTLNREFTACRPNEKWLTDVTEFQYGDGHKSVPVRNSGSIWAEHYFLLCEPKKDTALVLDTFERAFLKCCDDRPLVHSDRGTQYTSHAFRKRMAQEGICQSMSRPDKCLDKPLWRVSGVY